MEHAKLCPQSHTCGFSLLEMVIVMGLASIILLGIAEMASQNSKTMSFMNTRANRDALSNQLRAMLQSVPANNLPENDLLGNVALNSRPSLNTNAAALNSTGNQDLDACADVAASPACVSNASGARVQHPITLFSPLLLGLVTNPASRNQPETIAGRDGVDPARYNLNGARCTSASSACPIEVVSTFEAECPGQADTCATASAIVFHVVVRQAAGISLPGGNTAQISQNVIDSIRWVPGTGATGSAPGTRTIWVRHSQTTSVPGCPAGWSDLWDGYSYMGSTAEGSNSGGGFQDLGGTGSCIQQFFFIPFVENNFTGASSYITPGDFSMWLKNNATNTGFSAAGPSAPQGLVDSRISHCSVCSKANTTLIVMHNLSAAGASCPGGWTQLMSGRTFMGGTLNGASGSGNVGGDAGLHQSLSSTGSCLPLYERIPFWECEGGGFTCAHDTGNDFAFWGGTTPNTASNCVVCEAP